MAGRISALDEKLAALGQTQEDYLPSEIEKFKDATGYEEFLDFDPAEIKAALENPDKSRIDEMLAFAERQNGSMQRRRPPMCRRPPTLRSRRRPFREIPSPSTN